MTRDDILRMAREAGFQTGVIHGADGSPVQALVQPIGHNSIIVELERFYALAVAKEREARQDAQSRCEELKARIVKAGVERRRAVMDEREACAKLCDEMQEHYASLKDAALLNGDVELSNASSGEPRACEFLAAAIRARSA